MGQSVGRFIIIIITLWCAPEYFALQELDKATRTVIEPLHKLPTYVYSFLN